jgi:hypothetical protein
VTTPLHYTLILDPRLPERTFSGSVTIDIVQEDSSDTVLLDCQGLEILSVDVDGEPAPFKVRTEHLAITCRAARRIGVAFRGAMSSDGRGLYTTEGFAVAQLQPQYARRLFPCFDQPRCKATFDVTVAADRAHLVISNTSAIGEQEDHGRRIIRFARTAPMPPHMLAIAVGPFQVSESACDGVPVRFFTRAADGREAFALDIAVASLRFFQRWLSVPYPFAKLDLVAVPRLEVAAVENSGGVLFRESAVLLDAEGSTATARRNAAQLVAHEVSHQWFGSLVTPASWSDLWLSEGFATWLAPRALEAVAPERSSPVRETRALRAAMAAGSFSSVRDLEELFDAAAYQKGAAVLRMLEAWLGEEEFRAGVHRYLTDHANGAVGPDDLWGALGEGVSAIAGPLITDGGVPRLTFDWNGNIVRITQTEPLRLVPAFVKVQIEGGGIEIHRLLLDAASTELQLSGDVAWVFGNANAAGYYRCAHGGRRDIPIHRLTPAEAATLLEDLWDAVWQGETDILAYLRTAAEAVDPAIVAHHFAELRELLAAGARLPLFDRWIAAHGLTAAADESQGGDDFQTLLIDPATREDTWTRLKTNWDELRNDVIGFGGHGAITALGVVSDPAMRDEIAAFFAPREIPGAERALEQTLARIDARIHFRGQQQRMFDAWLARQSVPSVIAGDELRFAHSVLNALAAAIHGMLAARTFLDSRGIAAPDGLSDVAALQAMRSAVESRFLQLFIGSAGVGGSLPDYAAALRQDVLAAAANVEESLTRLTAGEDPEASAIVAAFLTAQSAVRQRFLAGMIVFADLFERHEEAESWRALARQEVSKEAALVPAVLRSLAVDLAGIAQLSAPR